MQKRIYRTLFICITSFYTSQHRWLVESRWTNQEAAETTGLAKQCLLGNKAGAHFGGTMTTAAILGGAIGIGTTALPNKLSSQEINDSNESDIPNITEKTNEGAVFGMIRGKPSQKIATIQPQVTQRKPITDQSDTDDEHGADLKFGMEIRPLKSDNENFSVLVTGAKKKNDKKKERREIDMRDETVTSLHSSHGEKRRCDSMAASKKRIIKSVAVIGTVAVVGTVAGLILALIFTARKNRDLNNMLDQIRMQQDLRQEEILNVAQMCEEYEYPIQVCQNKSTMNDQCHDNMIYCIRNKRNLTEDMKPKGCHQLLSIKYKINETTALQSQRKYFFDRINALMNRWVKFVKGPENLNCDSISDAFKNLIREMTLRFTCDYNQVFEDDLLKTSLEACEMFRDRNITASHMCLIHNAMNQLEKSHSSFFPLVAGAVDPELQSSLEDCSADYDETFHDTYFSSDNDTSKI